MSTATAKKKSRARKVLERPEVLGWKTSDDDEVSLRRWRGCTEIQDIEALEPKHGLYGTFRVRSITGGAYDVEIRDLEAPNNSCGCIDHRVNGLGTCKHVEGVLAALRKKHGARAFKAAAQEGSPRVEVFLSRRGEARPTLHPPAGRVAAKARAWLAPYLDVDGAMLRTDPATIAALLEAAPHAPKSVRVSRHFGAWIERERRLAAREAARDVFLADTGAGRASWDIVKLPLLPYQKTGALHLAFGERALLADEMGLGKTVQAIAACEILARTKGVERVLVVSPASVKAEWEEQIARFTDREARFVAGPVQARDAAYREPAFFTLVNYEQVLRDADAINTLLKPDVVVLDEAQRIKNWRSKTARTVKSLRSPYAFVLTGTPLENRIDETYSIVQHLDPELFGPLFRFNRELYQLDDRGRPISYKNLAWMRSRLESVMLRRRKADVERELPGRTVSTYFVPMAEEQTRRYRDWEYRAVQLMRLAEKRPLTEDEFKRLQQYLACMRMICDTPAILDPTCRICPKLEELEGLLEDLLADDGRKIVIFSEWTRMLALVRELAGEMGHDCAWHTGDTPQLRRRAEIERFRKDPRCRLFLSSDAGAVGLNLQQADCVINLDLPWNPAKLEQRIARVWRKGQMRPVTVVNLVTEESIEHNMLHLLAAKQTLADGVLDGAGDLAAIAMPSGRAAMMERMQAMLGAGPAPIREPSPEEALVDGLRSRLGARLVLAELRGERLIAVVDGDETLLAAERRRLEEHAPAKAPPVELVTRAAWEAMERLAAAGLLQFAEGPARVLHQAEERAPAVEVLQAAE